MIETEPDKGTGGIRVLWKADATVRQEHPGLDAANCIIHEVLEVARCSSVIVARRYCTSTVRLRTKTTCATSSIPVIQE